MTGAALAVKLCAYGPLYAFARVGQRGAPTTEFARRDARSRSGTTHPAPGVDLRRGRVNGPYDHRQPLGAAGTPGAGLAHNDAEPASSPSTVLAG